MVDEGGEFEELPFLEIDPAERIFELIHEESLRGKSYASILFERPVRVSFFESQDQENLMEVVGIRIETDLTETTAYSVGKRTWDNKWSEYYFDAGKDGLLDEIEEHYDQGLENQKLIILSSLEESVCTGFLELEYRRSRKKRSGQSEHLRTISGPLGEDAIGRGWTKRWIDSIESTDKKWANLPHPEHHATRMTLGSMVVNGCLAILVIPIVATLVLLFIPFLLIICFLLFVAEGWQSLVTRQYIVARRYPPFPLK